MQHKSALIKINSRLTLLWYVKVGEHLKTLRMQQLPQLIDVKPVIVQRWVNGKLAVPNQELHKIKTIALSPYRKQTRKKNMEIEKRLPDEARIRAKFAWKTMIFDQMNIHAKRRFCERLKMSSIKKVRHS